MRKDNKHGKLYARRALMLAGAKGTLMLLLAGRLYHLQILEADEYKTLSDSNRIKLFIIPPLRGNILDRNGVTLASNEIYYRILLDPSQTKSRESSFNTLVGLLKIPKDKQEKILKKIKHHTGPHPIIIHEYLSWDEVAVVEVNQPDLPGIYVEASQIRFYNYGPHMAQILGYVGAPTKDEAQDNPLLNHPDFKIGKGGIEKTHEELLRGDAGVKRMEVNAYGLTVRELSRQDSQLGERLRLTVDMRLQYFVHELLLKHRSASAVVMDISNGDILAMSSVPTFDPNRFVEGIPPKYWKELISNASAPMINKVIGNPYPPGSTFKIITDIAGLKNGIDPHDHFFCNGGYTLGRRRFRCWKPQGHGSLDMRGGIKHSCNVYHFEVARRIGIDAIAEVADMFGLGKVTGIELPHERAGINASSAWKKKRFGIPWQAGDTLNASIGQGFQLSTPLQLAQMTARLASRGKIVHPRLTIDPENPRPSFGQLPIPDEYFDIVLGGMMAVMNEPGGTAYGSRITIDNFHMAGKTGTSQVIGKERQNAKLWENLNHALFIGFTPLVNPRYAINVVVEHGGSGSQAAAPVARDIMKKLYELLTGIKTDLDDTLNGGAHA